MTFPRNLLATFMIVFVACNAYADQYSGLQLSARDISTLAALKVTPKYVQEMRSYFPNISAREITNLYALKVPPEYLKDLRSYFPNMDVRDVTNLYALKVPAEYVKQIRDLGFADISTREITNFYALKVKPEYIKQMRESGRSTGKSEHVHVPEIHIPEIHIPEIHIPEIKVQTPSTPAVPAVVSLPSESHLHVFHFENWSSIIYAFGAMLLMGFGGYYFYTRRDVPTGGENIDTRIAEFENRVNDLQDILLSIDDRLDRRLKRT